jgi:ribose 5-phosphate isomerase A
MLDGEAGGGRPEKRMYPDAPFDEIDRQRRRAAERAVERVQPGMVLGFGTGRGAPHALEVIALRGLQVAGVPTSRSTVEIARQLGLPLVSLQDHPRLDLTIDGADEVDPKLNLLKGGGGALLREKVLAAASDALVIVVEASKLVPRLGSTRAVPLEVLPFAAPAVLMALKRLGGNPVIRQIEGRDRYVTENGHWIVDCAFPAMAMAEPHRLDRVLRAVPGLLETGLFCTFRPTVFAGGAREDGDVAVLESEFPPDESGPVRAHTLR